MPLRTLVLGLVLVLVVLFAALNWGAFMTPMSLSLVFATVQAPLGLLMLGVIALLTVLFLGYLAYVQTTVLLDARRSARELDAQRELADRAEASRFTELRAALDERMQALESLFAEDRKSAESRLEELKRAMQASVVEGTDTLTAYIGELEDRLTRSADSEAQGRTR